MTELIDDDLTRICEATARLHQLTGAAPSRVRVQHGDTVVEVEWAGGDLPSPVPVEPVAAPEPSGHVVTAPLLGTFYRCPQPGAAPFVEPGDAVTEGQQVAVVEAMKLLNPVLATCVGTVRAVLVEDAAPVEFGQALLVIDPA